jgi:N-acetylglucosaminyldiphosphoundecaprenol N-acetyl-beta-D-mannosaminyltransferase
MFSNTSDITASTGDAHAPPAVDAGPRVPRLEPDLRALDITLATLALPVLVLPALLLANRRHELTLIGRDGRPFRRLRLEFNQGLLGRIASWLGAAEWPVWCNVWKGEMSVLGPRPRNVDETPSPALHLRPGLINHWSIRQRTAVDYGTEAEADRELESRRSLRGDLGLLLRGALVYLLPGRSTAAQGRVTLGDVAFDNLDTAEALARLEAMMASGRSHQVAFVNPACVNTAAADRGYRRALARCSLVLPDGIGIKLAGAILGTPLKQNLNGTDLFPRLCEQLQHSRRSIYLLGGRPGVPEAVAAEIARRWPSLHVAGARHGFFGVADEADVAAAIRTSGADCLLVARGVPVQEQFIDRHLPMLGVGVALGVGGLFDFVSGRIERAPLWMRDCGLEWTWRLLQEPQRMWRRYLVGNVTFLARVVAQRIGWRRPARDLTVPGAAKQEAPNLRAVVLAMQPCDSSLPLPDGWPAALLPLGHQTVIEHLMVRLAQAGLRHVDIVAGEHLPALREVLGDGERWGLALEWRLPGPDGDPGASIAAAARHTATRLIVGPGHALPDQDLLDRLAEADLQCADLLDGGQHATSWRSRLPAAFIGGSSIGDRAPTVRVADESLVFVVDAQDLAQAQQRWLTGLVQAAAPASWIREPWGARSPSARVHPKARVMWPALIGPGCVVEAGAEIGPMTVLTRDVIVGTGTSVIDSTVLASTYIGPGLQLERCIAQGERLYHRDLQVCTQVALRDAMLLPLHRPAGQVGVLVGRAVAALLCMAALPCLGAMAAWSRLRGRARPWRQRTVLCPLPTDLSMRTRVANLSLARNPDRRRDRVWAIVAGLPEVARGERTWFGARPRTIGQWHALPRVWQQALTRLPVGLVHAPAWADKACLEGEAQAMADVYGARAALGRRLLRREFALR